jgi:hypothetical protein
MRAHVLLLLMPLLGVVACAKPEPKVAAPRPAAGTTGTAAVAILPFRVGGQLDSNAAFSASPPDSAAIAEDLGDQAAGTLAARMTQAGATVVDMGTVRRAAPVSGAAVYDAALAARVARAVNAEVGVIGAITRYVERNGTDWGVTDPATVWYQAVMVRAVDGAVIDRERFEYTQQPLAANLLDLPRFLQGGAKWMTRRELLDGALDETATKFTKRLRAVR